MLQRLARVLEGAGRLSSKGKFGSFNSATTTSLLDKRGISICSMSSKSRPLPSALPIEVFFTWDVSCLWIWGNPFFMGAFLLQRTHLYHFHNPKPSPPDNVLFFWIKLISRIGWYGSTVRWLVLRWRRMLLSRLLLWSLRWRLLPVPSGIEMLWHVSALKWYCGF